MKSSIGRPFTSPDPLALALMAGVLGSALWSIEAAEWVEGVPRLGFNGLAALLMALGVMYLRVNRTLAHALASLVASLAILWQVNPLLEGEGWDRLVDLATRLNAWGYALRTGGINTDPLVFFILLLAFSWLVGYGFSWFGQGQMRPWWGIVPCGVALLINLSYAPPPLGLFFLAYSAASLLLLVRLDQRRALEERGLAVGHRLFAYSTATALLVVLAAWLAPTPVESREMLNLWYRVNTPWQEGLGQLNRVFGFLTAKGVPGPGAFDRALVLRGASNLSDDPVMMVEATEPRYWRGLSYDYYTGQGWLTQEQTSFSSPIFSRYPWLWTRPYSASKELTQTVTILSPKNNLVFAAGQPWKVPELGVNVEASRRPVLAITSEALSSPSALPPEIRPYADSLRQALETADSRLETSQLLPALNEQLPLQIRVTQLIREGAGKILGFRIATRYPTDITALYAASPLQVGQSYTVVSSVSEAAPDKLRAAVTEYPSWVADRYLQLPPTLPERVRALAQRITEQATNPYDKAAAIESYLRGFTYSTFIPLPPANADRVDFLLFTVRRGYSAYFSTAMAVMLRSVGVPARVAIGYTPGEHDPGKGTYLVRESNAHGWVEAYFPGYGWVEFEPTPSLPPLARPSEGAAGSPEDDELFMLGQEEQGEESPEATEASDAAAFTSSLGWYLLALGMVVTPLVIGLLVLWRRQWSGLDPAVEIYGKMSLLTSLARLGPGAQQTPREFSSRLQRSLPQKAAEIGRLVAAYERVRYGARNSSPQEGQHLRQIWRDIRLQLLRHLGMPWRRSGG